MGIDQSTVVWNSIASSLTKIGLRDGKQKMVTVTATDGRQARMPKATSRRLSQEQIDVVVERLFRGRFLDRMVCKDLGISHVSDQPR